MSRHDTGDIIAFGIAVAALWWISKTACNGKKIHPAIKKEILKKAEEYIEKKKPIIRHSELTDSTIEDFLCLK